MTRIGITIAAFVLAGVVLTPVSSAQAGDVQCKNSLAQYNEQVRQFEAEALKARALADQNPLYESDLGYYNAVLRDAKQCIVKLAPIVSAAR